MIVSSTADIRFELDEVRIQALPTTTIMVDPTYYQVEYEINAHMRGNVGSVDTALARAQWMDLRAAYRNLGFDVVTLQGSPGYPDMVFCANQTLPGLDTNGKRKAVLSRMASAERAPEVQELAGGLTALGYELAELQTESTLEGCGDLIWHHDARLLWCGYGLRSSPEAIEEACRILDVTGILLELSDERFYHLDTCLSILDRGTALWIPSGLTERSVGLVERLIPHRIEVPLDEAVERLACNAHCPDGKHVLIQSGCTQTSDRIRAAGFDVVEIETGEYLKAGGSVFCMKQMVW